MTVYIYAGAGSSPTNAKILQQVFAEALHNFGIHVMFLDENDFNRKNASWQKNGSLLIVGGGQFTPMKEKLSAYGRAAIQDFTAHKTYLGICKGGYAGSAHIEFTGSDVVKTSPGFGFFNCTARGSLPVTPRFFSGWNDSAAILNLYHEKRGFHFPALYWGGPSFILPATVHDGTDLLASYTGADGTKYAMGIKRKTGETGKAVLTGYHSEAMREALPQWLKRFSAGQDQDERLAFEMAGFKDWQYYLGFAALLDDLEIVKGHSFLECITRVNVFCPAMPQEKLQPVV